MSKRLGVILAGGLATRMGGGDKGLLQFGGQSLLGRVIDRLDRQVDGLALNANGDAARFVELGLPVVADSIEGFAGPLAGVLAGLDWAAEQGADSIVTAAADTPFFPRDLVTRLTQAAEGQKHPLVLATTLRTGDAVLKSGGGKRVNRHPTFGLWPVALRDDLRTALNGGLRKVVLWTDRHDGREALFSADPFDPFFNVNTPDDLVRAETLLEPGMRVYGVTGWKNAGKTGLVERLVTEITGRGFTVSTVKHAHHSVDVDQPGTDSYRHREAGASEVLLASGQRIALMRELRGVPEPSLSDLLGRLLPVDLVLIEGFKRASHPKVEAYRLKAGKPLIASGDASVRAVASDTPLALDRPVFDLDDTAAIADFILQEVGP